MNKERELALDLINFIDESPVSFYAVKNIVKELEEFGYTELVEGEKWNLVKGGRYYTTRNSSSVISFVIGSDNPWGSGFKIVGAHTDSPQLKVKNESVKKVAGTIRVSVEPYGGGISNTWLDRDLSLAGRVTINSKDGVESRLVDFKRAVGVIPNLAVHLNRDVNKGFEYNKQNHLQVILSGEATDDVEEGRFLRDLIARELNIQIDDILEMDLFFYDVNKGALVGINEDLISVARLDNLAMCHSILKSLLSVKNPANTVIGVFFDNEEIGSRTLQGADSNYLSSVMDRVVHSLGGGYEECLRARFHSFLISADGAHALHPNFMDKHDASYTPLLNKGPVIKLSANYRYATTSESAATFINLCKKVGVPYQKMANRSDIPSGSTIGPMSSASLGIKAVDVGNPMYAMHSVRESQGVKDHYYMTKVIKEFFNG